MTVQRITIVLGSGRPQRKRRRVGDRKTDKSGQVWVWEQEQVRDGRGRAYLVNNGRPVCSWKAVPR